jgi:peroxiredoxin Q/BCP
MSLSPGQPAPDFTLVADDGRPWTLSAHRGRRVLLVFYPGDNTPVCTAQLCDYRDGIEAFEGLGVDVVGISTDSIESHRKFKEKHGLPFTLLTDKGGQVARAYGAWGMLGMKRAVFLVERDGLIAYAKVESVALFRRTREELIEAIGKAGSARG